MVQQSWNAGNVAVWEIAQGCPRTRHVSFAMQVPRWRAKMKKGSCESLWRYIYIPLRHSLQALGHCITLHSISSRHLTA